MAREDFVAGVITEFGRELGMGDLTLDFTRKLTLTVGEIPVTFTLASEPTDMLWLHVGLGEISEGDRVALTFLLKYGHILWVKNLMAIGLNEKGRGIYGYGSIPVVTLNARHLSDLLNSMLETAQEVRNRLAGKDYALPQARSGVASGQGPEGRIPM